MSDVSEMSDEDPELETFLRSKVEENQQLVEYITILEENASKAPDEVKELQEKVVALNVKIEEYQSKEAHWEEMSNVSAQTESELCDLKKELEEVTRQASLESAEQGELRKKAEEEAQTLKEELTLMKDEVAKIRESQSRSLSRSNSSTASAEVDSKRVEELHTLRKAVVELREEVHTKHNLPPIADFKRIANERDALKQVVQKQHKRLSQLQKKLSGLPPRPPGSPGAVPCLDGHLIIEDCLGLEAIRSEAPSRNSGTETPGLPELQSRTASGFVSPAFLSSYSVTPELCHSTAHSEGRSRTVSATSFHSSRTCSINISEQSSERPALSISPIPSEFSSKMQSCPTSPAAAVRPTMTYPTSTAARNGNSYASQALTRAFNRQQQVLSGGRSDSPLRPIRYSSKLHDGEEGAYSCNISRSSSRRTSSPSASSRSRKSPSINPRDRAFAPLVFSIDP